MKANKITFTFHIQYTRPLAAHTGTVLTHYKWHVLNGDLKFQKTIKHDPPHQWWKIEHQGHQYKQVTPKVMYPTVRQVSIMYK